MNYTVLTACLNSSAVIMRSINSVISQEKLPVQYIFVDGGSTDNTIETIKTSGIGEHGIELIILNQKEKSGITGAWNIGLKEVKGDVVFILNSDDWYEPGAALSSMRIFEKNPQEEIVLSPAYFHSTDRNKFVRQNRNLMFFPFLMPIVHPGCFVKRSVYERLGYFNESYRISADYEFVYRCRKAGIKFCEIRNPLVNMMLGGTANNSRERARKETLEIGRKYCTVPLLPEIAYFARWITGR